MVSRYRTKSEMKKKGIKMRGGENWKEEIFCKNWSVKCQVYTHMDK